MLRAATLALISLLAACECMHTGVEGTVTDVTTAPLSGVLVSAYINGELVSEMLTEADGQFSVGYFGYCHSHEGRRMPDVTEISFSKTGYTTIWITDAQGVEDVPRLVILP